MSRYWLLAFFVLWARFASGSEATNVIVKADSNAVVCSANVAIKKADLSLVNQASQFIGSIFSTENWPARWQCGNWSEFDGWFYLISDLFIWLAYFAIPAVMLSFLRKRKEVLPFKNIFSLFIAFILLCGLTHLIDAIIFWWPAYRLSAMIRFLTATVSVGTVFALVRVFPQAMQLKSPDILEKKIDERTKELKEANEKLRNEILQRQKADEEIIRLNKSLSNFRNAIHSSSIVSMTDKAGTITYVNENFETISGYTKGELLGQNHRIINSGHHPKSFWVDMWKTIARGETWREEVKNKRKDGTFYWVDTFIMPFRNEAGKLVEILSIRNDITQRKAVEEDLLSLNEKLEDLVEEKTNNLTEINKELTRTNQLIKSLQNYAQIGVWELLDLEERKNFWSEEIYRMFELPTNDDLSIEKAIGYFHPEFKSIVDKAVKNAIENGESYDIEAKLITHKKNEIWVRVIGIPIFEDEMVVGLKGMFQNIDGSKRIEEELRTNQEINNLAIEAGELGVWSWNLKNGEAIWNQYMAKHMGISAEEFSTSHKLFENRIHPDDAKSYLESLHNSFAENKKLDLQFRVRQSNDSYSHLISKGIPIYDHENKPLKMIGICLNITERKVVEEKLIESNERFRLALEYSPIGMAIVDLDGRFLKVNKALSDLLGYSEEEMLEKNFQNITHPEDVKTELAYVKQLIKGPHTTRQMEKRYYHKNGNIIWVQLNGSLVRSENSEPLYFIAQIQDITSRKLSEMKIRKMNEELEAHSEKLEAINKELESFSYSVSHDLRAPLRSITGYAQVLREDYSGKLDEEGNRVLKIISNNALKMGQLIDDLLEFSRLGRKDLENTRVNMNAFVRNIADELLAQEPAERKINLSINQLNAAKADITMLKQVWVNLISNAIKYTRKKEITEIEIGCKPSGSEVIYFIKDNGAGFNMNYSHKLFNVFQRLHSSEEFEGTGVGLAIVKRIVNKHNGKTWAEAKQNEGATFYFTLPTN